MQLIPFTSEPNTKFTTTLNGVEYGFLTNYNERNGVWSFDLSLAKTGELLVAGVPVLIGCDLLKPHGLGIGSMYAVDKTAAAAEEATGKLPQPVDAGPEDFGVRVIVVYLAPGESLE